MKPYLILLFLVLTELSFGQIFSEDFESAIMPNLPVGWTQSTTASDGGFKTITNYTSNYFSFPAHTTYIGTNDDWCNCDKSDESLISPAISLPAVGYFALSFDYVLAGLGGESAEIRISTDGGATSSVLETLVNTYIGNPGNGVAKCDWGKAELDLSAYAGQTINLIWHYDDNSTWSYGLMIDDIVVKQISNFDAEMFAIISDTTQLPGSFFLEGVVKNVGANPITSVDVVWNEGVSNQVYTLSTSLNFGDTASFIHPIPLTITPGMYLNLLDVFVVLPGDTISSNDTLYPNFIAPSSVVPKKVVGELRNGSWCGWNPRGDVSLTQAVVDHPNNFIGISIHDSDPMTYLPYNNGITAYMPNIWPTCAVDRQYDYSYTNYQSGLFELVLPSRLDHIPPASISVVATEGPGPGMLNYINVDVTAEMVMSLSGDYRLAVALVHDSMSGASSGYYQSNYYSGGSNGPLTMPNYGSMANFEFHNAPDPIMNYFHDFVAVALGNHEINGEPASLPSNLVAGNTYTYSYAIPYDTTNNWSLNRMRAIGMLIDASTGEILNAEQCDVSGLGIDQQALEQSLLIGPNPNNGMFAVSIELPNAQELEIQVLNAAGELVFHLKPQAIYAGVNDYTIDLRNQATGLYLVQLKTESGMVSRKVNVIR